MESNKLVIRKFAHLQILKHFKHRKWFCVLKLLYTRNLIIQLGYKETESTFYVNAKEDLFITMLFYKMYFGMYLTNAHQK